MFNYYNMDKKYGITRLRYVFSAYRQINFIISEKLLRLNNRLMENTNKMSVNSFIQCLKGSIVSAVRHVVQMTYFNDSTGFEKYIYF